MKEREVAGPMKMMMSLGKGKGHSEPSSTGRQVAEAEFISDMKRKENDRCKVVSRQQCRSNRNRVDE